jgi:hypothetical protein
MRFDLKPSEQPNWWVLTDTENMIVMRFKEHDFNGSSCTDDYPSINEMRFIIEDSIDKL